MNVIATNSSKEIASIATTNKPKIGDFIPTDQQWKAIQEIEEWLNNPQNESLYLLTGFAGSGKSLTLQAILKRLRDCGDNRRIVFTAPTNKAVKVLSKMADQWDLEIDSLTCAKLLGLKPVVDYKTGKQSFEPDKYEENKFKNYSLIIVDECSMIGSELWSFFMDEIKSMFNQTQILFVGDSAQLPPVNEKESLAFSSIYGQSHLTEVVRYGSGIGRLAEGIRSNLESRRQIKINIDTTTDKSEGVFLFDLSCWEAGLIKAVTSDRHKEDCDFVRALAYTNKRVAELNQKIRKTVYGNSPRFVKGERLIATTPFVENNSVLIQNSEEIEVIDAASGTAGDWNVWWLEVLTDQVGVNGSQVIRTIPVLHESEASRYAKTIKALKHEKRWREYFDLVGCFAQVEYAYALTVHKSQGSTFENVFIDLDNLMSNRRTKERNQLIYTAVTRASKRVFIYQ